MGTIVSVYKTFDVVDADVKKAKLESKGIVCYLKSNDVGGAYPQQNQMKGIEIMVREEDLEKAKKILQ